MGNLLGKTILEGKKLVDSITEKATPVVSEAVKTFKEQSADLTAKAKRAVDISVLRAEIADLYTEFGKATFEWGLMPSNEKALDIMKVLYEKTDLLEKYEAEIEAEKAEKAAKQAAAEAEKENVEDIINDIDKHCSEETPADETSKEEKKVEEPKKPIDEDKKDAEVKPNVKKTNTKKSSTKKSVNKETDK